ncbi:hypothetical protein JYU20_02020 [Bacteroidales bacterium AH-315-I05]|nr:hypothetical protein [Bacteroidales bacterium AH-315-I05]
MTNRAFAIFLLLIPAVTFAQTSTYSPYSAYGLGEIESTGFTRNHSMGDIKHGIISPFSVNIANAASYGFITEPTFDLGVSSNFLTLISEQTREKTNNTYFRSAVLGLPIVKNRWGMAFGLVPYSKMGYNIVNSVNDTVLGEVNYQYEGEGGIHRVFWGNAVDLLNDSIQQLSLGANASFLFGSLEKSRKAILDESTGAYNIKSKEIITVNDFYFDFGLLYYRKINDKLKASFGASYVLKTELKSEHIFLAESFVITSGANVIKDTIEIDTSTGNITVPQKFGFGAAIYIGEKWTVGIDYSIQNWSSFEIFGQPAGLARKDQLSLGTQLLIDQSSRDILKKTSYRLGLRYSNTHLQVNNVQLAEYGISFGVGLPIVKSDQRKKWVSSFNIGVEFGQRGKNEPGIVQEQYANLMIGFSFTPGKYDRWFVRQKID